jgi:hypothetical protein
MQKPAPFSLLSFLFLGTSCLQDIHIQLLWNLKTLSSREACGRLELPVAGLSWAKLQ